MNSSTIYKPAARWPICAAFAAAALVHVAAVAVAERTSPPSAAAFAPAEDAPIDGVLEPPQSPEPIDTPPARVPPPPRFITDDDVPEEHATPRPVIRPAREPQTLLRPPNQSGTRGVPGSSTTSARILALTAPRPEYPYEARRQHLTGSGVATLRIDRATGAVTDVKMSQSTGSAVLDNAAISGFRRWRFRAGTQAKVQAPITFTLTGAAY